MTDAWFAIVALMLTAYVVLDGYDFGAGILHRFVARTDDERRRVISAIGPLWDGNEVWLLAAGGALFLAFPRVLAAGLSGFYLAIVLLVWCLIGRGVAVEFRSHLGDPLWRSFWDTAFAASSALLALFLGVALGNIVRGVPLDADGWFALPLFTDFSARPPVGILDRYTVLVGVFAVAAITAHGAAFLAWRTDGPVRERSLAAARRTLVAVAAAWPLVTWATAAARPSWFVAFGERPLAWLAVLAALGGLVAAFAGAHRRRDALAFGGTSAFLACLLAATAICAHPLLLASVPDAGHSLTSGGASAPPSASRGSCRGSRSRSRTRSSCTACTAARRPRATTAGTEAGLAQPAQPATSA